MDDGRYGGGGGGANFPAWIIAPFDCICPEMKRALRLWASCFFCVPQERRLFFYGVPKIDCCAFPKKRLFFCVVPKIASDKIPISQYFLFSILPAQSNFVPKLSSERTVGSKKYLDTSTLQVVYHLKSQAKGKNTS